MKLIKTKVRDIAKEILAKLIDDGDIEVLNEEKEEVVLDIEAVLNEYIRMEREITDRAKDLLLLRGLDYTYLVKIKQTLAEERGFGMGDEGVTYIVNQLLEAFMHSVHVEEVFADDLKLRRSMTQILKKNMAEDDVVDQEVRKRMKHIQEGTAAWEIEYEKVMEEITRHRKAR